MKITQQVKPTLTFYYVEKALKTFYPSVEYKATPRAPSTFKELLSYRDAKILPVFDGGCDQTIYDQPWHNHCFRAWHDSIHLEHNLNFSYKDELKTAEIHLQQLRLLKAPQIVLDTIWFDVAGQVEFYYKSGNYVTNQRQFVQDCLVNGIDFAIGKSHDTALSY